jgi:hypothetical protein
MDSFCNVFLKKRFLKCISKYTDTCYLFTDNIPVIKTVINKIKKNKKINGNHFQGISDSDIGKLYSYIIQNQEIERDLETQKNVIKETLYLDKYSNDKLVFVNVGINEDETIEMVLSKIIYNCYKNNDITQANMLAWYEDNESNIIPLSFEYEDKNITYNDIIDDKSIDTSFVDSNGDKIPKQIINKNLTLYENCINPKDVIYFITDIEYLEKTKKYEEMIKYNQQQILQNKSYKLYLNGLFFKYWPEGSISEILFYKTEQSLNARKIVNEKQKNIYEVYRRGTYIIESEFLSKGVNEKIECGNYSLTMLRFKKTVKKENTVHLSKLFTDFILKNEIPFMKLLLNSHEDVFYKVFEKSLLYEGSDKSDKRHITKDKCNEWSDSYIVLNEFGYNYLHPGNVIMLKVYNVVKDIYGTLIIHMNGDIECIIEHNERELYEEDLKYIIHDCNVILSRINMKQYYSFETLNLFDNDIFTNIYSDTKVDFLNSGILFKKEDFQDKNKRTFPNWNVFLGTFLQNFPMYFRVKTVQETENDSQIIGRYNRVDNYANITTIQSAIAAYKVIFEDPEIIIQKLAKDYNKDPDFIRKEYESWEELMSMKEGIQRTSTYIDEAGSEIKIFINQKEDLIIELKNMKSFDEQRRIFVFIKTMMKLYLSYINDKKGTIQRRLFETVDEYMVELFDDDEEVQVETVTVEEKLQEEDIDDLDDLLDDVDMDAEKDALDELLDTDDEEDDDDVDFDQLGGGNDDSNEGYFETKSYYLKRLKEYDPELFKFKSKKKQASGVSYGYPKLCGAVDHRNPIAVTGEELERIDNSYEEGSGKESYSEAINVPRRPDNIKYICPKYWDISTSLSLRPDYIKGKSAKWKKDNIVPAKLPKGSNGRTTRSILERSAIYWTDANEVKYYLPDIKEESKQLHPMGYGLPCCFNSSKLLKGDPKKREQKQQRKEAVAGEGYISNKDPVNEGKYAHLHPFLMKYFDQTEQIFNKKRGFPGGFLRKGVRQNDNDYVFNTSPFLQSYFKIVYKEQIPEEGFVKAIRNLLLLNLDKYQKCPIIHQKFRKDPKKITSEDHIFIMGVLDKPETRNAFSEKTINRLKNEIRENKFKSNETCYLFQLLLSLHNYLQFLNSDENRDDTYILPLLTIINDINIVIFENVNGEIKIKLTEYTQSKKIGFMYKRGNFYEPILYRKRDFSEDYLLTEDLDESPHYKIIFNSILEKIMKSKRVSMIETFEKIIESTGDKVTKLMIDNSSNVTHLISLNNKIVPIIPEPIPLYKKYQYLYSYVDIQDIKVGMDVKFGPKYKFQGRITKSPFGKRGREQIGVKSKDGKLFPKILCSSTCILDDRVCMQLLPTYDKVKTYINLFKEYFSIKSCIKNNDDEVTTLVMSNDTFIPILNEKLSLKIPSINGPSFLEVDNVLYSLENINDDRMIFINMKNYEDYIIKLGIHHILTTIRETTKLVKGFVKDKSMYNRNDKIHFLYYVEDEKEYIEKIDKQDYIYSQFETNYTMDGTIRAIKSKDDLTEIIIEIELYDELSFIINDPIMIDTHKKIRLYKVLEPAIDSLFHLLKEKDYQKHELDNFITLCNERNELCNYPCGKTDKGCKLYVREKDSNGNLLVERIKWTFIEKLLIFGIENKEKIIEEKVSVHELMNSTNFHEIFYTFSEFKNDILNQIFTKKSKYITNIGINQNIKKRNIVMKKLDTIPYSIQKIFGKGSSVVFNLTNVNNDFMTLEKAFFEAGIQMDAKAIKNILIDFLEGNVDKSILNKYSKEYASIEELVKDIKNDYYRIHTHDLEIILQNLLETGINLGIILMSSKYSKQKKHSVYFYDTNLDIMDIESVPIIPLYHAYYKDEFILANILINYGEELNYYSTISDLYSINNIHKKWIKI